MIGARSELIGDTYVDTEVLFDLVVKKSSSHISCITSCVNFCFFFSEDNISVLGTKGACKDSGTESSNILTGDCIGDGKGEVVDLWLGVIKGVLNMAEISSMACLVLIVMVIVGGPIGEGAEKGEEKKLNKFCVKNVS